MKKLIIPFLAVGAVCSLSAKKILSHDDFDSWEKVTNYSVSKDGKWATCGVNPQEGDGVLTFYETGKGKRIDIPRGYSPRFSPDCQWGYALIKPFYKDTRQAKIDKKKDFDMPQDSLAIINLKTGEIEKIGNVISYKIPKEKGEFIAWLSCDTTLIKPSSLKDKDAGRPLIIRKVTDKSQHSVNWVSEYSFGEQGNVLSMKLAKCKDDSLATDGIGVMLLPDTAFYLIDRDKKFYSLPTIDREGNKMAYIASEDSVETGTRMCQLYLTDLQRNNMTPREIAVDVNSGNGVHRMRPNAQDPETQQKLEEAWMRANREGKLFINQYSQPSFSHNGKRLVVGVAPYIAPDDTTLIDFEKASLDIWRWDAPFTPPQENNRVEEFRKHTYPVIIDVDNTTRQVLTTTNPLVDVIAPDRWDGEWALLEDPSENIISIQWDYQFPVDLLVKNIVSGEEKNVGVAKNELYELSPAGKYVMMFKDRQYYVYDIATGETKNVSAGVPYPLWDERQDVPLAEKEPYGVMGWSKDDKALLVYDKHDVWSLDPRGEREPFCLTSGEGRFRNVRFRNIKTDPDFRSFSVGDNILYSVFDYENKYNGLASAVYSEKGTLPKIDMLEGMTFNQIRKAKDANVYSWVQGNFNTSPNVFVSTDITKGKTVQITESNPQMKDYNWGTAQLFKWYAYDGSPAEGVLYLPEDFDPSKEYPMISYFYETYTDELYYHYDMEPSWSWINFPFYVSRGYVIFVPDIHYTAGVPGESAWNYVCSGVEAVCNEYPNIDKNRIGIDGQSWGGYQTAYLVTRTNMFACAGSGAPVANMTSAYGGIRWQGGDSRQAQYEVGQSRIGRDLWDATELYLANSPVFYANRVETPLLIMHNDADGAVPWYQGIEMFMALRRLGKPVWMLQYNSEAHNLRERRNRKDITKRLQQFFDHYLKGDPMPEWMEKGIPAVRKGQNYGF